MILACSAFFIMCVAGVFLGLYWRVLVLDNFIEMDTASISSYFLFALYVPVGIGSLIIGAVLYLIGHKFCQSVGIKVTNF